MRKKAKKLLAFLLCLLMLVPTMGLSAFASGKVSSSSGSSSSNSSISDVSAILNALSYDEYKENVLDKHASAGKMTLYSNEGAVVGTITVSGGEAAVLDYNGTEYSLAKQKKNNFSQSTYVSLAGTYTGSAKDLEDIELVIDSKGKTAKITIGEKVVDTTYTLVETIELVMNPQAGKDNQFSLLDGEYEFDNKVVILGEDAGRVKQNVCTEDDDGNNAGVYIGSNGVVTWTFNVPEYLSGNYIIEIKYAQAMEDDVLDGDSKPTSNPIERIFYLNGEIPFSEARSLVLSKVWKYDYKYDNDNNRTFENEKEDGSGDDIRPSVKEDQSWVTYAISDSNGYEMYPFEFYVKPGENAISLEGQREGIIIQSITLRPQESLMSYSQYKKEMEDLYGKMEDNRVSLDLDEDDRIEAEGPENVSAVTMYPVYDRTSAITSGLTGAQSESAVKYNTAGKEQWQNVGEWMSYEITVPESGYYSIAVRYKQALLSGMYVSRKLYIDGEVPFAEAANCRFPYTSSWQTCFLGDGETEFEFYFEAGKTYEIKLEATLGEMGQQIKQVSNSLTAINEAYLEILKLTGTDPDSNRSYGFTRVMPHVLESMLLESQNLESVYNYMIAENQAQDGGTGEGEKTATIKQVYQLLEKMATDESEIPANLATLKSQIGSLGTWINSAKTQPLQVDYYLVQSIDDDLPKADANFFEAIWFEIKLFFASFAGDYNTMDSKSDGGNYDEVIEVWVVTGRDQAQIIRNLIENNFTPEEYEVAVEWDENGKPTKYEKINIGVNIKLISGGTLLPSIIAGVGPEVSLMEVSTTIIDYALRNAIKPLNEYVNEDIKNGTNILDEFPEAAIEPLTLYNFGYENVLDIEGVDHEYTWVEEDLYLWREDGTTITNTSNGTSKEVHYLVDENNPNSSLDDAKYGYNWKNDEGHTGIELYALPDTLTFSMMFYREDIFANLELEVPKTWDDMLAILPILQYNNMELGIQNDAYTFIYQNGHEAYSNNGMTINFDSKGVLNAFETMCNYYTQYSLPYTYDFANRFRTGEMPIGIAPYTTCNQLAVFASELSGLWTFVKLPGEVVVDENGNEILDENGNVQINRNAIGTVTGCVMIDNGNSKEQQKKDDAAWEFMKWYTGHEFQADYSNGVVSIMGIAARPATANRIALEELPWTAKEKSNILDQFNNLEAVPNHPGSYYLARYVNFAFLAAYNDGEDASDALLSYVTTINAEIERRREEFGMLTKEEYDKLNPDNALN
ncbi:MAG: extracellular solute-binding protein [Clostridia bacterium]|nr:extracellular solute-binding protein [Clostridia bacterium]